MDDPRIIPLKLHGDGAAGESRRAEMQALFPGKAQHVLNMAAKPPPVILQAQHRIDTATDGEADEAGIALQR